MKKYNIAILGATGAVGRQMLKCLEERNIPVKELKLLASARSAGKTIPFAGKEIVIREACDEAFAGCDFVLGAVSNDMSKQFAPAIKAAGAVYIDNSSAFRMCRDVPLVVPEINASDIASNNGIIANPNCSTIISLVAVNALNALSPIESMVVSTYQAVSGAGQKGIETLDAQVSAIASGEPIENGAFRTQIAFNLIPEIGSRLENGYTTEEMKLQNEGRKIMHLNDLLVSCTCVRVPVYRSHSISIRLVLKDEVPFEDAVKALRSAPGVKFMSEEQERDFPTPLDTTDQDYVYIGRIRRDLTNKKGLVLWCCGDQIRKGAATNAVQILEAMIEN